jgi:predicted transcriptional regulator
MVRQVNKEKLSITLDPDVHQFVQELADKDDRSVSSMINVLLKKIKDEREGA